MHGNYLILIYLIQNKPLLLYKENEFHNDTIMPNALNL
jgi:hypothetical protein